MLLWLHGGTRANEQRKYGLMMMMMIGIGGVDGNASFIEPRARGWKRGFGVCRGKYSYTISNISILTKKLPVARLDVLL